MEDALLFLFVLKLTKLTKKNPKWDKEEAAFCEKRLYTNKEDIVKI